MPNEITGIIVAAGSGVRMGGVRKPLIKLSGVTVFERVLDAFCRSKVDSITVVGIEGELRPFAERSTKPIRFVSGGKTRMLSVFNGVMASGNICAVHDCARPFVTAEIIDAVIDAAMQKEAATACCRVTDTVKLVDREKKILSAPDRDHLFAIQTPQCFGRTAYLAAFALAQKQQKTFTDESTLLENAGFHVEYVECPSSNIKLTTAEDVKLAKAMLFLKEHS